MQQSKNSLASISNKSKLIFLSDAEEFMKKKNGNVILDTNILIQGCSEGHEAQRKAILNFCSNNKVHITETIHYEFLRNLSIDSFRKKYRSLWKMVGGEALSENEIAVQKWFLILSYVYFEIMKNNTKKIFFDYQENDRWITACALGYGIDSILTTDHGGGFPKEIFGNETFNLSTEKHKLSIHLKKIDIDAVVTIWSEIQGRKGVHLAI